MIIDRTRIRDKGVGRHKCGNRWKQREKSIKHDACGNSEQAILTDLLVRPPCDILPPRSRYFRRRFCPTSMSIGGMGMPPTHLARWQSASWLDNIFGRFRREIACRGSQ